MLSGLKSAVAASRPGRAFAKWRAAGFPLPPLANPARWFAFFELLGDSRPYVADRETDAAYWAELRDRTGIADLSRDDARDRVDALVADGTLTAAALPPATDFTVPPALADLAARHGDVSLPAAGLHVGLGVATASADGRWVYLGGDDAGLLVAIDPGADAPDTIHVTDGRGETLYEPISVAATVDHFLLLVAASVEGPGPDPAADAEPFEPEGFPPPNLHT